MVGREEAARQYEARSAAFDDANLQGMNGGQIFAELMRQHGVKHVFGYPGGAILPVFDGMYQSPHFDVILPRHEQGAGHMAEGYARATGQPGVVVVTSGPGATNTITPMQDAMSDGIPLVVFTGQVPTTAIGSDAFQEADVLGISRFCTKCTQTRTIQSFDVSYFRPLRSPLCCCWLLLFAVCHVQGPFVLHHGHLHTYQHRNMFATELSSGVDSSALMGCSQSSPNR